MKDEVVLTVAVFVALTDETAVTEAVGVTVGVNVAVTVVVEDAVPDCVGLLVVVAV